MATGLQQNGTALRAARRWTALRVVPKQAAFAVVPRMVALGARTFRRLLHGVLARFDRAGRYRPLAIALTTVAMGAVTMSLILTWRGFAAYGLIHLALGLAGARLVADVTDAASLLDVRSRPLLSLIGFIAAVLAIQTPRPAAVAVGFDGNGWATPGAFVLALSLIVLALGERQRGPAAMLTVLAGRMGLVFGGLATGSALLAAGLFHFGRDAAYGGCLAAVGGALVALSTMELKMLTLGVRLVQGRGTT